MPLCRCKWEPRGYRGVEGFQLNQVYEYSITDKGEYKVSIYDEECKNHPVQKQFCVPDYFYWLTTTLFNKIFKDGDGEIDIEKDY
jgi:hypothetical protein